MPQGTAPAQNLRQGQACGTTVVKRTIPPPAAVTAAVQKHGGEPCIAEAGAVARHARRCAALPGPPPSWNGDAALSLSRPPSCFPDLPPRALSPCLSISFRSRGTFLRPGFASLRADVAGERGVPMARGGDGAVRALDGVDGGATTELDDEAWVPAEFTHEPPVLAVTQPKGSFCQIDARFSVALDPEGVYHIITDPNNRRVFKNIKEVVFRKVLEDDGNRQLVDVEQLGRWRFLMLSGTFSSRVIVEQNRRDKSMLFDLAQQGMMKKFSGSWKIEPMLPSEMSIGSWQCNAAPGSWVNFQQVLEPAIVPPWPLNGYVRGVTERIIREMLADLQRECLRLSQANIT